MAQKLQTRNTVVGIKKEVTEGTPVSPAATTDYIAVHEGFTVEPAFEEIENAELQASIGKTKGILGFENPTFNFSHYMRASGVEGQAPNFGALLESNLGAISTAAAEYNTVAASTTSIIKVDAGEGATFERGEGLLIKDGVNGYAVRNVLSVSTDDLNLAQNLGTAPALGVNLGKAILYKVAESDHPTISSWIYRANKGAIELVIGGRVTEMSVDATAGQPIIGSFTVAGIEYKFDPIEITASNKYIDFDDGGGEENVSVAVGFYKDPYELAAAIQTAIQAATTDVITVSYSDSTRKFTITSDGATFELLFLTGTNNASAIDLTIGYSHTDHTAAITYTSDSALSFASPYTPEYDSEQPLVAKNNHVMIGSASEYVCFGASRVSITSSLESTPVTNLCAASGKSGTQPIGRTITFEVEAYLEEGQAEEFRRYRENEEIMFTYTSGRRSGGNWVPGSIMNYFSPTSRISAFSLVDGDGIVKLNMTVQAYVSNGLGEFYINCL